MYSLKSDTQSQLVEQSDSLLQLFWVFKGENSIFLKGK